MRYEYEHKASGGRMIVERPMKSPPPETLHADGREWKRVYEAPLVTVKGPAHQTTYSGAGHTLPISHSLPPMPDSGYTTASEHGQTIRVYKDGTRADGRGRRIMADERDATNARRAGFVKAED